MSNLFSRFQKHFPSERSAPFIITDSSELSYGEMERRSAQIANALFSLGLKPGDRLAVQVAKTPEALLVYLASLRAGLIYLPLYTAYTVADMGYFVVDAEPALMLCDPSREQALKEVLAQQGSSAQLMSLDTKGQSPLLTLALQQAEAFADVPCEGNEVAAILYTSGTTGRPKGAMLSHDNLAANAFTLKAMWGFQAEDVLLHALPIFHVHGLFVACHCVLASGASMIFQPGFEVQQVMAALPRATVLMGVPTFYTRLLDQQGFDSGLCSQVRLFISGSAPLLEHTHQAFAARTGHIILERYGMTETGMLVSNPLQGERRAGTVGFPLPEVLVRVVDSQQQVLPAGEVGSIQVKGPNVFQGYWRKPEKTAQEFTADGYFITGDQGTLSDDGYISIVGRAKDMVISGGFNVYPKEVELVLDELPGIKEAAVIGLPHPDFGEAVTAVVVLDDCAVSEADIITLAKQQLGAYKVPKKICFVDALPRNTMGKVQKNLMRQQYAALYE